MVTQAHIHLSGNPSEHSKFSNVLDFSLFKSQISHRLAKGASG